MLENVYLCGGNSASFRQSLLDHGGKTISFPKGQDITPYLKRNAVTVLIEEGILVSSIHTTIESESYLFAVGPGTIIPKFDGCFSCKGSAFEHFIPLTDSTRGVVIASERLLDLRRMDAGLREAIERDAFSIISAMTLSTALFRNGAGINRVCNVLYCLARYRADGTLCTQLTQKELAAFTGLSLSQLKRVLAVLRGNEVIETSSKQIRIRNLEAIRPYISETLFTYPCMCHHE